MPERSPAGPVPSSPSVTARMSRQARQGTAPEMAIRRLLHARGFRYRVAWPVPGLPRRSLDIAFTKATVAVSVHGCFWHGCPEHGTSPQANSAWWRDKIERNRERDAHTRNHLQSIGWSLVEVWEHERPEEAVEIIVEALRSSHHRSSNRAP